MNCPNCHGNNVSVQIVQTGAVTRTKSRGCLFTLGRWFLILITCGLWLVFGRKKSKSQTTFTNEKHAVCSGCGHTWTAK